MKDKTILITGAGSGIGRSIAQIVSDQGARHIVLLDLDEQGLSDTKELLEAPSVDCYCIDVSNEYQLESLFADSISKIGAVDYLFNVAGIQAGQPAWPESPLAKIRSVIEVNLLGTIFMSRLVLPLMKERGGSILNLGSTSGLNAYLSGSIYAPSKAAVIHFTRCNESLFEVMNVRMNSLCPAMVDTPFLLKTGSSEGEIAPWLKEVYDTGQVLSADDVAAAAVSLARDVSKSGQIETMVVS